jgi:hypothetical protein
VWLHRRRGSAHGYFDRVDKRSLRMSGRRHWIATTLR